MIDAKSESEVKVLVAQLCPSLCEPMDCSPPPPRFFYPWDSPGKNTGMGCHSLLQGVFWNQGLNLGLPTLQADSLPSKSADKVYSSSIQ